MNSHDVCINDLTNSPLMPMELVHFRNIKTEYSLNEDILLEYVLDAELQPSFRDWIGLYPRGWTDFHECVTFEWVTIHPCEASLQRNILFHWKHHSQFVYTDREYQFLYVNQQLEILGHSLFFRFSETDNRKNIHMISSENALTSSISLGTHSLHDHCDHIQDRTCQFGELPTRSCASVTVMLDGQQMNLQSVSSDTAVSTLDVPSFSHPDVQNHLMTTCSTCKQQIDLLHRKYSSYNKVESSAELIDDLEDRIHDLMNDLEVSQVAQKHLKFVVHQSEQKMLAYQKFVNNLCLALSQKGIVRVIDGQGTEMLVKQVLNTGAQTDVTEGHPLQNVAEISHEDPVSNSVIDTQAQVMRELLLCLDSASKACSNFAMKMESVRQVAQSLIAVMSCSQEDTSVIDLCEASNHSLNFRCESPSNEAEPVCLVGNSNQKLGKVIDEKAKRQEFPDHSA